MRIKVTKTRDIDLPSYSHEGDSGADLINAGEDAILKAGERKLFPAGIKVAIPRGYEIQVRSRSGLAIKRGLLVLNSPGTIDAGYRGEIGVILFNTSGENVEIKKGMKIAQAVLQKVEEIQWEETGRLPDTTRGSGGFGSTG